MPLFEYACRDCGHHFEYLTRAGDSPSCPACASVTLEKQLSVFAVSTHEGAPQREASPTPCGMCGDPRGPGACSIN
ncbi:MAG: zinc ribbon domain-containing protein [Acidimicrobiia bacterium]|nr:zinc ribbon domain-containing protein [Acidimicrobiia bacterium]